MILRHVTIDCAEPYELARSWSDRRPAARELSRVARCDIRWCPGGNMQAEGSSATVDGVLLRHVTIDCADPYTLATFWSTVTGWHVSDMDEPGDDEALVEAPAPVPGLLFIRVPEQKSVKNRIHFDWMPTDRTRDEEVERILALGAKLHEDHCTADGRGWVTLLDPEGNEFCVERSAAERES